MDFHFQGVQDIDGKLAVVGAIIGNDGSKVPILLPAGYAHTLGCALIELSQLAKEREPELKASGKVLDVNTIADEFGRRMTERLKLNGSGATVSYTP
jgi:hypothetical protein